MILAACALCGVNEVYRIGGAQAIDVRYYQAARSMGSSSWDIFRRIILPGTLPSIVVGATVGIGIAWASILAMPYAILASSLPQRKLGIYMGLFNVFIVIPQLLVATVMGSIMKAFFPGQPIWTMLAAAIVMGLAALAMLRVPDQRAA